MVKPYENLYSRLRSDTERQMENLKERRRYSRYRSKEDGGAFVAIRPTFQNIGTVKDVSLGGVGFQYVLSGDSKPLSQEDALISLDMFVSNNGFYLPKLKCRLAYDVPTDIQPLFPIDMQFRSCGVEFDETTSDQRAQLQLFFEKYTAGEA